MYRSKPTCQTVFPLLLESVFNKGKGGKW